MGKRGHVFVIHTCLLLLLMMVFAAIPYCNVQAEDDGESSGEFLYIENSDGVTIVGCDTLSEDIIIPPFIKGKAVTAVWSLDYYYSGYYNNPKDDPYFSYMQSTSDVTQVMFPDTVRALGKHLLYGFQNLKEITLPAAVESIDPAAFSACTSLETIKLSPQNTHYTVADGVLFDKNKTTLIAYPAGKRNTSYTVPLTVTVIGEAAFDSCVYLESIKLPGNLILVGNGAFAQCNALKDISIPASVENIGEYLFYEDISLKSAALSCDIATLPERIFDGCNLLATVKLPEQLSAISGYAFRDCTDLQSIAFPDALNTIGFGAFSGCSALKSIDLPANVRTINEDAFSRCGSLASVSAAEENETFSSKDGVLYNKSATKLQLYPPAKAAASFVVPEGVAIISEEAFYNNRNLKTVVLPDSLTRIEKNAFSYCRNLTSVNLPPKLEYIELEAFSFCTSLQSLAFPASIKTIEYRAFYECRALSKVTIPTGVGFGVSVFDGCDDVQFYYAQQPVVPTLVPTASPQPTAKPTEKPTAAPAEEPTETPEPTFSPRPSATMYITLKPAASPAPTAGINESQSRWVWGGVLLAAVLAGGGYFVIKILRKKKAALQETGAVAQAAAEAPTKFCLHCGASVPGGEKSCPICGKKV